ncbi:hypothetical protein HOLleu_45207 [Holothuria leucospilota]|uniref:Tudor-knot domain-containing protein n=1 Tax=Holothuria leucospilota TaxID=206669 RepID=A0A9Q0Y9P9_HOLLE|nr:hypothetical protein HOLleu_45207 [Holothuria leucospilota]
MNLRPRGNPVNYVKLHCGEPLKNLAQSSSGDKTSHSWSTKKLYTVEVLSTRQVNSRREVKVHYAGWSKRYDEWRLEEDIVQTPSSAIDGNSADFFQFYLLTSIKEKLTCCRKKDSEISFSIPVPKKVFPDFVERINLRGSSHKGRTIYRFESVASAKESFGNGWWYRIVNEAGDFCSIELETFQVWFNERPCLEEFDCEGNLILSHRGFQAVVRFVTFKGNKHDLSMLLTKLT